MLRSKNTETMTAMINCSPHVCPSHSLFYTQPFFLNSHFFSLISLEKNKMWSLDQYCTSVKKKLEKINLLGKKNKWFNRKWKINNAKKGTGLIFDLLCIVFLWFSMIHGRKFKLFQGINVPMPTSHLLSHLQLLPALPPIIWLKK